MRRADGIAVAARSQRACQQFIEVAADAGNLLITENPNSFQIAVAIESRDLFRRQGLRVLGRGRMKAQIPLDLAQIFGGRDEPWCGSNAHGLSLDEQPGKTSSYPAKRSGCK